MAETFRVPRIEATCPTGGGALRVALDSAFVYQVDLMEAILNQAYSEKVFWDLEQYYEPLTATLVNETLAAWHARLSVPLAEAFKDAFSGISSFAPTGILEAASGPLWVEA